MLDKLKKLKPITAKDVSNKFNNMMNKQLEECGCTYNYLIRIATTIVETIFFEEGVYNFEKIRYRDGISKYLLGIKKYNSMGFSNDDIKILNLIDNLLASDITINGSKFIIAIITLLRTDGYTSYIKEDALYIALKQ